MAPVHTFNITLAVGCTFGGTYSLLCAMAFCTPRGATVAMGHPSVMAVSMVAVALSHASGVASLISSSRSSLLPWPYSSLCRTMYSRVFLSLRPMWPSSLPYRLIMVLRSWQLPSPVVCIAVSFCSSLCRVSLTGSPPQKSLTAYRDLNASSFL